MKNPEFENRVDKYYDRIKQNNVEWAIGTFLSVKKQDHHSDAYKVALLRIIEQTDSSQLIRYRGQLVSRWHSEKKDNKKSWLEKKIGWLGDFVYFGKTDPKLKNAGKDIYSLGEKIYDYIEDFLTYRTVQDPITIENIERFNIQMEIRNKLEEKITQGYRNDELLRRTTKRVLINYMHQRFPEASWQNFYQEFEEYVLEQDKL